MAAKHHHRCRSCKHFDLAAAQNKAGAVIADRNVRCNWSAPVPKMPISAMRRYGFESIVKMFKGEEHLRTEANQGEHCDTWEQR